jgi:hypothetical protein
MNIGGSKITTWCIQLIFKGPAVFKTSKLMVQGQASFTRLLVTALLLFISGCAAPLRPGEMTVVDIEASRLGFLKAGVTTKNEVKTHLGPPTFSVAKESVWGYRMTLYSEERPTWDSSGCYTDTDRNCKGAIPDLRVQESLDSVLVTRLYAPPYELVLVFDESSTLKIFRVFRVSPNFGLRKAGL